MYSQNNQLFFDNLRKINKKHEIQFSKFMLIFLPLFLFYQIDLIGDSKPTKKVAFVDNNLLTIDFI